MTKKQKDQIPFVARTPREKSQIIVGAALRSERIYITARDVAIPGGDRRKTAAPWYERGMVGKGTKFIAVAVTIEVPGAPTHTEIRIRPFERDAALVGPDHDLYYELLPTLDEAGALNTSDVLSTFPEGVTSEAVIDALIAAGTLKMDDIRAAAGMVVEDLLAQRRAAEVEAATTPTPGPNLAIVAPPAAPAVVATK